MPAESFKIGHSSADGFLDDHGTIHWRDGDFEDNRNDVVKKLETRPPGTRFKLVTTHTIHVYDTEEKTDESTDVVSTEEV